MLRIILIIGIITSSVNAAPNVRWNIEVTLPSNQIKSYYPSKADFDVKLGASKWKCVLQEQMNYPKDKRIAHARTILCNLKDSVIGTTAVCYSQDSPRIETVQGSAHFFLKENKEITFISLSCD